MKVLFWNSMSQELRTRSRFIVLRVALTGDCFKVITKPCNYYRIWANQSYIVLIVKRGKHNHNTTKQSNAKISYILWDTMHIWGVLNQKHVSKMGTSNHKNVGCNYLSLPLIPASSTTFLIFVMTSSNGSIFSGTSHVCGWISRTKTSDAELWCFLWFARE